MKKIICLFPFLLAACTTLPTSSEYLLRGDGYFKDGHAGKAVQSYTKALKLNPDNLEGYASRGAVYMKMGKTDLAEKDFNTAKTAKIPEKLNIYSMVD